MKKKRHNSKVLITGIFSLSWMLICCTFSLGWSQTTPALEEGKILVSHVSQEEPVSTINQIMSIDFENVPLLEALQEIAEDLDMKLSYSKEVLPLDKSVTAYFEHTVVNEVIYALLEGTGLRYAVSEKGSLVLFEYLDMEGESGTHELKAQTVSGSVTDAESGESLPGVNIAVKGTTQGVSTDGDGRYELEAPTLQDTLIFSFVGYETQEIPINGRTELDVQLQPQAILGEEMVVVGYGEQERISVTGAISSTEVEEVETMSRSITNNLAGRVSGIIAVQRSGEPGYDASDFWIRGISTFQGAQNPLVLVDGVERSIDSVDPEAIESFSVLKDASATAVYGVRGANGVILIKTKSGEAGPIQVKIESETGIDEPTKLPSFVDGAEYMELYNEAAVATDLSPSFSDEQIENTRSGEDPYLYPSVDWIDAVTKNLSTNQRHRLTLSGGGSKVRYYLTGSYFRETGIFEENPPVDYDTNIRLNRYNFRSDIILNASQTTDIRLNVGGHLTDRIRPGRYPNQILRTALETSPISFPAIYPDGTLAHVPGNNGNPYTQATHTGFVQEWRNELQTTFNINQKLDVITEGLEGRVKFSYDTFNRNEILRTRSPDQFMATGRDENGDLEYQQVFEGEPFLGYERRLSGNRSIYLQTSLHYKRDIQRHSIGGLLLFNQREFLNTNADNSLQSLPNRNQGISGRINYNYNDKYFAEVNFGYNGSENFAEGERYGFFPSVSAGWAISNESFMDGLNDIVSFLKIRGSHGLVGNDQIGGRRFAYLTTINSGASGYNYGRLGNQNNWGGNREGQFGNPDLSWETVLKTNIGLELGLLDKIDIEADYFVDKRADIFIQRSTLPTTAGYQNNPWANFGKMRNQGVDISAQIDQSVGNSLSFSFKGNFTYAHNTITEMDEPERLYEYQERTGKRYRQQFGLIAEGLFTEEDFDPNGELVSDLPDHTFGPVRPGDIKYRDVNEDGKIDSFDEIAIGSSTIPEIVYGFGVNVRYKNFNLGLFFQGVGNTTRILRGENFYPFSVGLRGSIHDSIEDRWTPESPSQDVIWPRLYDGNHSNNYQSSTWWQRNASFMRLKNAEISYQIPKGTLQKLNISSLRVYVRGSNIYTWTTGINMWDSEIGTNDGMQYPPSRKFSLGLEINI